MNKIFKFVTDSLVRPLEVLDEAPNTNPKTYFKPIEFKSFKSLSSSHRKLFNEISSNNIAHTVVVNFRKTFIDAYDKTAVKMLQDVK